MLNKRGTGMTYHCKGSNKGLFGGTVKTLPTAVHHLIKTPSRLFWVKKTYLTVHQGFLEFFDILLKISCISETTSIIAVWNICYMCLYYIVVCRSRISSVSRGLDCSRAGGRGFDSQSRAITQGLKILDKWRYSLCTASGLTFAPGSDVHVKWLSRLKL